VSAQAQVVTSYISPDTSYLAVEHIDMLVLSTSQHKDCIIKIYDSDKDENFGLIGTDNSTILPIMGMLHSFSDSSTTSFLIGYDGVVNFLGDYNNSQKIKLMRGLYKILSQELKDKEGHRIITLD